MIHPDQDMEIESEWEGPNPPPEWKSETIARAECGPEVYIIERVIRRVSPGKWQFVRVSRVEKLHPVDEA